MPQFDWHFIEELPAPKSGGVYLVELDDGMYTLAKCTSSWVENSGSPVVTWLSVYYSYNMKFSLPVKCWCEIHEGGVRRLVTDGVRANEPCAAQGEASKGEGIE